MSRHTRLPDLDDPACLGPFTPENSPFLTIKCQKYSFTVLKSVVCNNSEWFRNALKPGFKEHAEGIITFKDDNPLVVESLINCLYGQELPVAFTHPRNLAKEALHHFRLFCLADRLLLPSLADQAAARFTHAMHTSLIAPADFEALALEVYAHTAPPCAFRAAVVRAGAQMLKELGREGALRRIDEGVPAFHDDLLAYLVENAVAVDRETRNMRLVCGVCPTRFEFIMREVGGIQQLCCPVCRKVGVLTRV